MRYIYIEGVFDSTLYEFVGRGSPLSAYLYNWFQENDVGPLKVQLAASSKINVVCDYLTSVRQG